MPPVAGGAAGQAEHARLEENTKEALLVVYLPLNAVSVFLLSPDFPWPWGLSSLGTWGILLLPIWAVGCRVCFGLISNPPRVEPLPPRLEAT